MLAPEKIRESKRRHFCHINRQYFKRRSNGLFSLMKIVGLSLYNLISLHHEAVGKVLAKSKQWKWSYRDLVQAAMLLCFSGKDQRAPCRWCTGKTALNDVMVRALDMIGGCSLVQQSVEICGFTCLTWHFELWFRFGLCSLTEQLRHCRSTGLESYINQLNNERFIISFSVLRSFSTLS